jgi:hypothetical protein
VRRSWALALSFLYIAFVRILQLLHLSWRDSDELAVGVAVTRLRSSPSGGPTCPSSLWVPKMSSEQSDQEFFTDRCAINNVGNRSNSVRNRSDQDRVRPGQLSYVGSPPTKQHHRGIDKKGPVVSTKGSLHLRRGHQNCANSKKTRSGGAAVNVADSKANLSWRSARVRARRSHPSSVSECDRRLVRCRLGGTIPDP